MGYTDSQKLAISENLAWRKAKAIALREQRGRWVRRYKKELIDGKEMSEARAVVLKQFDECTERKLDNALAYVGPSANPGADVLTEGRVLLHLQRMETDINVQCDEYDRQLDDIDDKEAMGEKHYETEVTEHTGGKDQKVVTKKVPMSEARHLILKRKVEAREKFTVAVKNLRGGTIINIDNRSITADMSEEDLDREIKDLEGKNRIKGGVTIVETD